VEKNAYRMIMASLLKKDGQIMIFWSLILLYEIIFSSSFFPFETVCKKRESHLLFSFIISSSSKRNQMTKRFEFYFIFLSLLFFLSSFTHPKQNWRYICLKDQLRRKLNIIGLDFFYLMLAKKKRIVFFYNLSACYINDQTRDFLILIYCLWIFLC